MGISSWWRNEGYIKLSEDAPFEQSEKPAAAAAAAAEISEKSEEPEKSGADLDLEAAAQAPKEPSSLKIFSILVFYFLWASHILYNSYMSAIRVEQRRKSMWQEIEDELSDPSSVSAFVLEKATQRFLGIYIDAIFDLVPDALVATISIFVFIKLLEILVRRWHILKTKGNWARMSRVFFVSLLLSAITGSAVYYRVENILEIRSDRRLLSSMKL